MGFFNNPTAFYFHAFPFYDEVTMKKTTKRIVMVFGAVIVLIILMLALFLVKMRSETQSMSPSATQEITGGVYAVKDANVNLFLIKGNDGYIAVDAGNSSDTVRREMQKLSIDPLKVVAVFLTHTDLDHVAALGLFAKAKIYISKDEEQMINGKTPRFFVIHNKKIPHYELLNDNQTVSISGLDIRGIATPGHTPGSMSYVVNGAFLFTGDTMSLKEGKAALFNEFFNMDSKTEIESIRKLATVQNLKYVFTAHYGFTDNTGKAFGNYLGP
jgi:glyoxylase-like metal-dependent hydrolase (beta-lactamase superfamily II)